MTEKQLDKLWLDVAGDTEQKQKYGITIKELEKTGEQTAWLNMLCGLYGHPGISQHDFVMRWLSFKGSARRDAREEEILLIARTAERRANRANLIAWIAAASTAILSIIEIMKYVSSAGL